VIILGIEESIIAYLSKKIATLIKRKKLNWNIEGQWKKETDNPPLGEKISE
jgi:hypothetical protein